VWLRPATHPNSEEALGLARWENIGMAKPGDRRFQRYAAEDPFYQDARYALDFVASNP
jgi:hypothetical protein